MKFIPVVALAFCALGCIEREEEYTLNPDGSGKAVIAWVGAPFDPFGRGEKDPEVILKRLIRQELESKKGIDCWKDVTFSLRPDGKITFRGTAYFKSFNDLQDNDEDGPDAFKTKLTMDKDDKGNLVLTSASVSEAPEAAPEKLGDEDLKKAMTKARFNYQQARPALKAVFTDFQLRWKFSLPGDIDEVRGFAKADRVARVEIVGNALLKAYDDLYLADEPLKKAVQAGANLEFDHGMGMPPQVLELALGSRDLRATMKGALKPSFDYAAEVTEKVREDYKKLLDSLPKSELMGVGMAVDEAVPADGKSMEETLRENLVLDLSAPTGLKSLKPPGELNNLLSSREDDHLNSSFSYEISGPSFSMSSGGGNGNRRLSLKLGEENVERFECRIDSDFIAVRQGPGFLRVTYDNESTGLSAILSRTPAGVQFVLMRASETLTRRWASFEEAEKSNPAELGLIIARLRALPLTVAASAADPEVSKVALRWADSLDDASRRKLDAIRQKLLEEAPELREQAMADLKTEVGTDPVRVRYLVESLEALKGEADARAKIQRILDGQAAMASAITVVQKKELHRDLTYLGALLADETHGSAAKARLKALTSRDFATRADFDAWHAANKDKLKWDAAAGKYVAGP